MINNLKSLIDINKDQLDTLINQKSTLLVPDNTAKFFYFALRNILFEDTQSNLNKLSWNILEIIEQNNIFIEDIISPNFVRDILNNDSLNSEQVFKLVYWIYSNTYGLEEFKMAIKQEASEAISKEGSASAQSNQSQQQMQLYKVVKYIELINHTDIFTNKKELEEITLKLVKTLGQCNMPSTSNEISEFLKHVEIFRNFFKIVASNNEKLQIQLFEELIKCIKDHSSDNIKAGPGLVTVLQLLPPSDVWNAISMIALQLDDASLICGLNTITDWLFQWTKSPKISEWIIAIMNGLAKQQRFNVLEQVANEKIKKLCNHLFLPAFRKSASDVLFYILCSMQNSPSAFLKAVELLPKIIQQLQLQNTPESRQCLQELIDICVALMENFTQHQCNYLTLNAAIESCGLHLSNNYKDCLNSVEIVWPKMSTGKDKPMVIENRRVLLDNNNPMLNSNSSSNSSCNSVTTNMTLQKVGLRNTRNTCYMNSVLQALFMTEGFRNEILKSDCLVAPIIGLQALFTILQFSKKTHISLPESISNIRPIGFTANQQHDSSEYMNYLLDYLYEQEKGQIKVDKDQEDDQPTTIVERIFTGHAVIIYRCNTCGHESQQKDWFRDLQLSIPLQQKINQTFNVQELLQYFMEPEKLNGDNKYYCENCRALSDAERIFCVTECPRYLILTLKHFRYDQTLQQRNKLFKNIKYNPLIILNKKQYELYAAVVHIGHTPDLGHYLTYARHLDDNPLCWYKFNDTSVTQSSFEDLVNLKQPSTPYILFYRRSDQKNIARIQECELSQSLKSLLYRDRNDVVGYESSSVINKYFVKAKENNMEMKEKVKEIDDTLFEQSSSNIISGNEEDSVSSTTFGELPLTVELHETGSVDNSQFENDVPLDDDDDDMDVD